jgi:hypothetical protein
MHTSQMHMNCNMQYTDKHSSAAAKDEKLSKHQLKRQTKLKKKESISAARKKRKGKSATSESSDEAGSDGDEAHEEVNDTCHGHGGADDDDDGDDGNDVNQCEGCMDKVTGGKNEKSGHSMEDDVSESRNDKDDTHDEDTARAGGETQTGENSSENHTDSATRDQSAHISDSDADKNAKEGGDRRAARTEGPCGVDAESHAEAGPNGESGDVEYDQDNPEAYLARKDAEALRKRGEGEGLTPCSAGGPEEEEYNEDAPDAFLAKKDAETMRRRGALGDEEEEEGGCIHGKMQALSLGENPTGHTHARGVRGDDDVCPGMGPVDVDATTHDTHADMDKDGGAKRDTIDSSNVNGHGNAREEDEECAGENDGGGDGESEGAEEEGYQPWQKDKDNRAGDMSIGMQKVLDEERHSCGLRMCLCELLKVNFIL